MEDVLTRILAHFAANGFTFGHDWNGIVLCPSGALQIYYPGVFGKTKSYKDWRDRVIFDALVIADQLKPEQFEAWRSGELSSP